MDQWYSLEYWTDTKGQTEDIDRLIEDFNQQTGLIGQLKPEGLDSQATTKLPSPRWVIKKEVY